MISQPRTVLEARILAEGKTASELAEAFAATAAGLNLDATMTERHLRRFASGERRSARPQTQRVLEAMFNTPFTELIASWSPTNNEVGVSSITLPHSETTHQELLEMTVRRARQFTTSSSQYVASEAIEQLRDDVRHIAESYPRQPLTSILGDLVETQDVLFTLLDHRHRPDEMRQLYLLGGVVGGILAKASHDMGDAHGALTHSRTGFLLAEHAEHDGLRSWIKTMQSFIAYWSARPHEAIRYAKDAAQFAERSGNTTGVFLAANEARAWAMIGNGAETRAAIERGERTAEQVTPDEIDDFGGICTFGRSRQLYYAADALARLDDGAEAAEQYATDALEAYSDTSATGWSFSDQAGSAADLAIARIAQGQIDGAAEALDPVLELDPTRRIHGIITSVEDVRRSLARTGPSQAANDLQMEIETFLRTPPAGMLSGASQT